MPNRTGGLLLIAVATGLGTGCVDRRFVVRTNVPGAQVYRDGTALGPICEALTMLGILLTLEEAGVPGMFALCGLDEISA